ncbi:cupin domain-containing protein [Phenylobacterium deserti]|uniref:Mannose-6-phosphate isomerase n=1 Tax=Phenylobacterium deserti TaxID=1914756 RepID=A0A328A8B5_9CAUL|nr:cupin domain-containing protein [Phenylobacterium deserti]RAK50770.1 mannose-6-phosphate isomerase [Phenylobacterium deserti]
MSRLLLAAALALPLAGAAQAQPAAPAAPASLSQRIAHTDPAKFRSARSVHGGAGELKFGSLLGTDALDTNFIFLHRGEIQPGGGIGAHFHNACEEMFVILDGEAQFTIDGRTSQLKGPVGAPNTMGHSHAIYNPTDKPVQWLNINVGTTKVYDNFDLGDSRVGAPLDPIPTFMTMRLDRSLLKPVQNLDGGQGEVLRRQALGPAVFRTAWSYVDHVVIAPGASVGPASKPDMSEVYYVLGGRGSARVGAQTAPLATGDALPVRLGETRAIRNDGTEPLELMVIGVAKDLDAKRAYMLATAPQRR